MGGIGNFFTHLGSDLWDSIKIGGRDISTDIKQSIDYAPLFKIHLGPVTINVTHAIIAIVLTIIILAVLAIIFVGKPTERPNKRQALTEKLIDVILGLCRNSGLTEEQSLKLMPWALTIGLYIMVSNLIVVFHIKPASQNPVFPITLALFTMVFVIVTGIRFSGLKGFWYSLINPMPALLPFNLLDYIIKPVSLAFRLFGNIFGAYVLIEFVTLVVPLVLPQLLGLWFDIGDGIVQGIIFMFLTINYVGEIVEKCNDTKEKKMEKQRERLRLKRSKLSAKQGN